jgi:dolichol kinase
MTHALCAETGSLALELHSLLRATDPARWRSGLEKSARARLDSIRKTLQGILERHAADANGDSKLAPLYERLQILAGHIEKYRPSARHSTELQEQWMEFQKRMRPKYAALAKALDRFAIPVPALRPTNYGRNLFHFGNGLLCMALLHYLLTPTGVLIGGLTFAAFCWTMEGLRVRYDAVTRFFMWILGPIAHPHEHHRVNSSTWFATAVALLVLFFSPLVCTVAVAVLCVADPVAALIGRRWGRTRIRAGRTLEGSLGFVAAGTIATTIALWAWFGYLGWSTILAIALVAAVCGALAEIISKRIDDNLTIPLGAAVGATVLLALLGA